LRHPDITFQFEADETDFDKSFIWVCATSDVDPELGGVADKK